MSRLDHFARFLLTSVVLLAFVAVGYMAGSRGWVPDATPVAHASPPAWIWESASGARQMSLATGRIEEGVEGVFALDHLTGDLFCWVLSPRDGTLSRSPPINVAAFLGSEGEADFVMCTGWLDIRAGRTGGDRLADSVVYVGDGNTGKVAAFSVFYGNAGVRLEPIPGSRDMMTRDPRSIRDQGQGNTK
jgi:hypothetical protein